MSQAIKFDPNSMTVGVMRDFSVSLVPQQADPALPIDGATFGIATMTRNSPHDGERHPDGDEVLYLISGRVRVVFVDSEEPDIDVMPGDGLIVPKGVWHRVDILEPSQIVYLTPGPNNEYRPLTD